MANEREGFVFHVLSKYDEETDTHAFERVEKKDGKVVKAIRYMDEEPLGIFIPKDFDTLVEAVADYSTKIGGETFEGAQGKLMRTAVHDSEGIWSGYKADMKEGEVFDDPDHIRATCESWVFGARNGKKSPEVSESKIDELSEDIDALKAYIRQNVRMTK